MKRFAPILLPVLLSVVGCAAPAQEEAVESNDSAWTSSSWTVLASCDNGAAVLDVDRNDRTNVQLVIRDRRIVEYLQSKTERNITNAKGEIIITTNESLKHPLWSFADFGKDDFWRYNVQDFFPVAGVVKRDGPGVKVILAKRFEPICEGGYWGYQGGCLGGGHTLRANVQEEAANWYFRDCH